jgi:glycosyltransferase involved in cell wall biosynthesis
MLYRIAVVSTEKVFFQNRDDKEFFIKNKLVKEDKTIVVPGSGVDTDFFKPEICKNIKRDRRSINFLLISRMLWEKGIREFVEGAKIVKKKFPQAKFQLLGWIGNEPSAISAEIIRDWEKEGIIEYLGAVTDVRPIICQSDVVVLPSYYKEGVPRSLLEAMAMEKPIITTNSVGCKDVIENNKNGFQIPIKDVMATADAMRRMIQLGAMQRKAMGRYGRLKAKKEFEEDKVITKYIENIKKVIDRLS